MNNLTIDTNTGFYLEGQSALYDLTLPAGKQESTRRLEEFYETLQSVLKPDVCFDVGAGAGDHAMRLHHLLPETQIIAFEGNPIIAEPTQKKLSGADGMLQYVQRVIGENNHQEMVFICRKNSDGSCSLDRLDDFNPDATDKANIAFDRRMRTHALNIWLNGRDSQNFSLRVTNHKMLYRILKGVGDRLLDAMSLLVSIPVNQESKIWRPDYIITFMVEGGLKPLARDFPKEDSYFRMLFVREKYANTPEVQRELKQFLTRNPEPEPTGKIRKKD